MVLLPVDFMKRETRIVSDLLSIQVSRTQKYLPLVIVINTMLSFRFV
jgi:hypothetical protein